MGHAYTPGLRVTERTVLHKVRRLPIPGKVHVQPGDIVTAAQVVASTELPGSVTTLNVAREMNCQPDEVPGLMTKAEGDRVTAGEVLAESKALWGLFHSFVRSPLSGTIESISEVTGQVLLRGEPTPVNLEAFVDGRVIEIRGQETVVIACSCAYLQGIFGLGGEAYGPVRVLCSSPEAALAAEMLDESCAGQVVVGGAYADIGALRRAIEVKAAAVVVGGLSDSAVDELLGYHLGVAVTGHEALGTTLIMTEGFGRIPMAERSYRLLAAHEGQQASVSGATQIRAGVIRPEIVISRPPTELEDTAVEAAKEGMLELGCPIRLIREPYFGLLGEVVALPEEPQPIETEALVRVLVAKLADGREVTVPRANVELIEQ
ncbi:MAG: hypothetical protein HPY69_02195 [Armatimonadetes bacterium]|nr:hypothetical protein [Armatimonadota bacterium]